MSEKVLIRACPLCESSRVVYDFVTDGRVVSCCKDCDHLLINPRSTDKAPDAYENSLFDKNDFEDFLFSAIKTSGESKPTCLVIGRPITDTKRFDSTNIPVSDVLYANTLNYKREYDLCILNDVLDYSDEPYKLLRSIHESLVSNGLLSFYLPVLNSKSAKKLRHKWSVFSSGRQHFFSSTTIQNILCRCGFEQITVTTADDDGIYISCRAGVYRDERVISIIIPVYNEEKTVLTLLNNVLNKQLGGLQKEIIIVESNSEDSTRGIVEGFVKKHPEVKLILEERPRGKGHAVRAGFKAATGDFILIQDGDLEYDVNDYDKLITPLVRFQKAFVLGSRHTGDWKMRDFGADKRVSAAYVNIGHVLFAGLINIGCGVKLKDPFTMYKLFRRECLYGLVFDGNRFEIDWEIVIKLIRKGFIPEEIPVNYVSRGFSEGKKISMIKDPFIVLWGFIKYRYFYSMTESENR